MSEAYPYGENDAVVLTRRVGDKGTTTDGSVHRTCMGPNFGCRKLVWASRFSQKREAEIREKGGSCWYMCMQCSRRAVPDNAAAAKAAGMKLGFLPPSPAEWADIEKSLPPFERIKLRLVHVALFGHLPKTGD